MFTEKIELAEEEIVQISEKIDLLESMLDSQTTLAALQGVVQRCKDSIADFDIDCVERVNDLTPLIEAEPKMLIESNARFFNTCSTYEDDGDYDPEEVKHCMEVLSEVDDIFHRTAQNRKNIVTALKEKQEAAKANKTRSGHPNSPTGDSQDYREAGKIAGLKNRRRPQPEKYAGAEG